MGIEVLDASTARGYCPWSLPDINGVLDKAAAKIKKGAFRAAAYLTDPICKAHELYQRLYIVDAQHPTAYRISNYARKLSLFAAMLTCAAAAIFTTLPGIALRGMTAYLQKEPFIYVKGDAGEKTLPSDGTFSLLSWNICCTAAGYAISDGGVFPWTFRIDDICDKIAEKNADVNCLYETFDTHSAFYLCEKLKQKGYAHFYFNIGPKAVGVSSGIFVASKYAIDKPEFTPFPLDSLVGRTKHAAKGLFAFDLQSKGNSFARIHATHLQHSEESQFPTDEELDARRMQMEIIVKKIDRVRNKCIVLTGDLNLGNEEYNASSWSRLFQKGDLYSDPDKTWGGEEFYNRIAGKRISAPMNLDHTMIVKGTARGIQTSLVKTGYDMAQYRKEALSDHAGLFSRITV